jgi:hypothetical protein
VHLGQFAGMALLIAGLLALDAALVLRRELEAELGTSVYRLIPDLTEHALTVLIPAVSRTARGAGQPM